MSDQNMLVDLMDALRPLAGMRRFLTAELKDEPEAPVGVVSGVIIKVKDIEHASMMYAKCAAAYKVSPSGSWTDTIRFHLHGGRG